MKSFQTIKLSIEDSVATVTLNRPEIRNAFNAVMIQELGDCFRMLNNNSAVKVVLLNGSGKAFCAGADLNWMKDVQKFSIEENYADSLKLADCLYTIYTCAKPTIAVVHGAAIGGANGLFSTCDMAYCAEDTVFSLSEVKIGIVPACIAPYILKRVGEYGARELMLTGERIHGAQAAEYGLVNRSMPREALTEFIQKKIHLLKTSGPQALSHCKNLINEVTNQLTLPEALNYTARMIAEIRSSAEGQEGMLAFLEKRKPGWCEPYEKKSK